MVFLKVLSSVAVPESLMSSALRALFDFRVSSKEIELDEVGFAPTT